MRYAIIAIAAVVAACSQPAPDAGDEIVAQIVSIDPAILEAVHAVRPNFVATNAEHDLEDGEVEVSGTINGEEYELDLMQSDGIWRVTQVQRDVAWANAPEAVRSVYAAAPDAFEPVRVIESADPVDGAIYYQLFSASDQPGHPSVQVRWFEGEAAMMPPAH